MIPHDETQEQLLARFIEYGRRLQQARGTLEAAHRQRRELMERDLLNDTDAFRELVETDMRCKLWPEWCANLGADLSIIEARLQPTLIERVDRFRQRCQQAFQIERDKKAETLLASVDGDMQVARELASQLAPVARWKRLAEGNYASTSLGEVLRLESKHDESIEAVLGAAHPATLKGKEPQSVHGGTQTPVPQKV
jgi:hypothetical protein